MDSAHSFSTHCVKRRRIGEPLVLPNGLGINYAIDSTRECPPQFQSDSGYSESITDVQRVCQPERASVSQKTVPPRHRRPRDHQQAQIDVHENMSVDGQTILFHHIRPGLTPGCLDGFLKDIGFNAPFNIIPAEDGSFSLQFSHSNVATAAFSLLKYRAGTLFTGTSEKARPTPKDVIDLTEAETINDGTADPVPPTRTRSPSADLYGTMDPYSIYDSGGDDNSESENEALGKMFDAPDHGAGCLPFVPRRSHQPLILNSEASRDASAGPAALPAPLVTEFQSCIQSVKLPQAPHNRARRIILPRDGDLPIMTVSMRADFQFFHPTARHRVSGYSLPNNYTDHRHVRDAVSIGDVALIGYRCSPCQVALICSEQGRSPRLSELKEKPHALENNTHGAAGIHGVNCLAAMKPSSNLMKFFTGGYDRSIRLWSVTTPDLAVHTERLATLATIPHALVYRDQKLLVGTSRKILALDLGHLSAKPIATKASNVIHQIHVHKQAPNVIIFEVDSLDLQIQIFDIRKQNAFDRTPDCTFGARCKGSQSTKSTSRGDSYFSMFSKGFMDGGVRVWDFRNTKQSVLTNQYPNMGAVEHTVFDSAGNLICYNGDSLNFVDIRGGTK